MSQLDEAALSLLFSTKARYSPAMQHFPWGYPFWSYQLHATSLGYQQAHKIYVEFSGLCLASFFCGWAELASRLAWRCQDIPTLEGDTNEKPCLCAGLRNIIVHKACTTNCQCLSAMPKNTACGSIQPLRNWKMEHWQFQGDWINVLIFSTMTDIAANC